MKKILASAILLLSILTFSQAETKNIMSLTDVNGKNYSVEELKNGLKIEDCDGKIVFLEFFGHRCPPCLKTIPHLIELQEKYKDKLKVIAIEVQGLNNSNLKSFIKQKGINYTVATMQNANEVLEHVSAKAQWQGSIPFMVAIDKEGTVTFAQAGMLPQSYLEKLISKMDTSK